MSLSIAAVTAITFMPLGIQVDTLGQVALPVAIATGKIGLALALLGLAQQQEPARLPAGCCRGRPSAQQLAEQRSGSILTSDDDVQPRRRDQHDQTEQVEVQSVDVQR